MSPAALTGFCFGILHDPQIVLLALPCLIYGWLKARVFLVIILSVIYSAFGLVPPVQVEGLSGLFNENWYVCRLLVDVFIIALLLYLFGAIASNYIGRLARVYGAKNH